MSANGHDARPGRFFNRRLRRASFISPVTGERSKRVFTLREASHRLCANGRSSEETPLLGGQLSARTHTGRALDYIQRQWTALYGFLNSSTGRGILKCSLAYLLGSLVTFIPALSALIGSGQDSKHMVATVTVWFHPARSIGSMHSATILALLGFLYSGVIGFTSMAVSMFFAIQDLLIVGHVMVLLIWIGVGLGFVAWTKQYFADPIVNVACSLASLGCITVLIKEGSVQAGEFSDDRVVQVLLMVLMGIVVVTVVNSLILPVTARMQLRNDLTKSTDLLGEMLICTTRAFLSGRENDLQDEFFTDLQKEHQTSLQKMSKDLLESRNEFLVLGRENISDVMSKLVDCLEGLAQDLGGLRSAALAQFALVNEVAQHATFPVTASETSAKPQPSWPTAVSSYTERNNVSNILDVITEAPEETGSLTGTTQTGGRSQLDLQAIADSAVSTPERQASIASIAETLKSPDDMFLAFITQLGPPTKSLVYTMKQILDELPFGAAEEGHSAGFLGTFHPKLHIAVNEHFHTSLKEAIELYRTSRRDALNKLYASRALSAAFLPQTERRPGGAFSGKRTISQNSADVPRHALDKPPEEILADMEEVSACCGHFSFSLLDFAEDMLTYLHVLDELQEAVQHQHTSWKWLKIWQKPWRNVRHKPFIPDTDFGEHAPDRNIPEPIRRADEYASASGKRTWTFWLYSKLRFFRRDDVKFAIKVGIGAIVYSLPAFVVSTRPLFVHWRGEWGLVSYMAVCCMTLGAANTTGINRFIGTFIGACLAIVAWILASDHGDANPYLLAFFGWLVSTGCFYLILAKDQGPMGRFILLTYNLGALYAYSLSVHDDDHDDDEGGVDPAIFDILLHRVTAVVVGTLWAIIVCRAFWPISARRKLKDGLCVLWLRMSLVWKRDPLAMFLLGAPRSSYMDIREEAELHTFLTYLDSIRTAAKNEFELRGPFPDETVGRIVERTRRMLDAFHAMNVVITKNLQCTPGEAAVLRYTREQRSALSSRISHLFSVLASSYKLEYPLGDAPPSIENSRDALLARISEFRRDEGGKQEVGEQDYELLYAYVLVTGQLAREIYAVEDEIESLFGRLNEEDLKLQ